MRMIGKSPRATCAPSRAATDRGEIIVLRIGAQKTRVPSLGPGCRWCAGRGSQGSTWAAAWAPVACAPWGSAVAVLFFPRRGLGRASLRIRRLPRSARALAGRGHFWRLAHASLTSAVRSLDADPRSARRRSSQSTAASTLGACFLSLSSNVGGKAAWKKTRNKCPALRKRATNSLEEREMEISSFQPERRNKTGKTGRWTKKKQR